MVMSFRLNSIDDIPFLYVLPKNIAINKIPIKLCLLSIDKASLI